MLNTQKIVPCLWFDDQAEEAAQFYVEVFCDARITNISRKSFPLAATRTRSSAVG